MESIFDIFFEHKMEMLPRCGLKTRQNRTDVVDHLNAVISGYAEGMLFTQRSVYDILEYLFPLVHI